MADDLVLPSVVQWDVPEDIDMMGEGADRTRGSAGAPAASPSAQVTPEDAAEGGENIHPQPTTRPPADEGDDVPDDPPAGRTIFGRWATIVPINGRAYCHFPDPAGPLQSLVLPPASQVHQRYKQALAFMKQQPTPSPEHSGQRSPPYLGLRPGFLSRGPRRDHSLDAAATQGHRCPLAPLVVRPEDPRTGPPASSGAAGATPTVPGGSLAE